MRINRSRSFLSAREFMQQRQTSMEDSPGSLSRRSKKLCFVFMSRGEARPLLDDANASSSNQTEWRQVMHSHLLAYIHEPHPSDRRRAPGKTRKKATPLEATPHFYRVKQNARETNSGRYLTRALNALSSPRRSISVYACSICNSCKK